MEKNLFPDRAPYEKKAREIMKKLGIALILKTEPGPTPAAAIRTLENLEQAVLEIRAQDNEKFLENESVLVCPDEIIVDEFRNKLKSPQMDRRAVRWHSSVEAMKNQLLAPDLLPAIKQEVSRIEEEHGFALELEYCSAMSLAALDRLKNALLEIRQEEGLDFFPEDAVYIVADKRNRQRRQKENVAAEDYFALDYFVQWDDSEEEMEKELRKVLAIKKEHGGLMLDTLEEDTLS